MAQNHLRDQKNLSPKSIQIKSNLYNLKESDTLAINRQVQQLRLVGQKVHNFGMGQVPFEPPVSMQHRLIANSNRNRYTPPPGIHELRSSIAQFYLKYFGLEIQSYQVIVGPGSKELLFNTFQILDSDWILPTPHWVTYPHQIRMAGSKKFKSSTSELDGYRVTEQNLRKTFNEIEGKVQSSHLSIVLNYPNNPTGLTIPKNEIVKIARFAANNEILILSDEIYGNLSFIEHESIAKHYPEGTITTGGMSKDRAAGGWRVGVVILPDQPDLISAYTAWASESYSCIPEMIQQAAVSGYETTENLYKFIQNSKAIHQLIGDFAYEKLVRAGFNLVKPEGAYYLFPRVNQLRFELEERGISTSVDLCNYFMQEYQIAALPGTSFGLPAQELCFRLSLVDYRGNRVMKAQLLITVQIL
ncbi:MAG: pyridoxal phosphate-dependent aminotransferase [Candidatus Kariarchaeaceae archaeon]|jgi:aspartate/methionine/tyrosine aminotransferase